MEELQIRPVMSRVEQKRFIRLPWRIYKDDPCWMPPLVMAQEELLGFRRHPFYEASRTQSFLASRGGKDVGRITAIVNAYSSFPAHEAILLQHEKVHWKQRDLHRIQKNQRTRAFRDSVRYDQR